MINGTITLDLIITAPDKDALNTLMMQIDADADKNQITMQEYIDLSGAVLARLNEIRRADIEAAEAADMIWHAGCNCPHIYRPLDINQPNTQPTNSFSMGFV